MCYKNYIPEKEKISNIFFILTKKSDILYSTGMIANAQEKRKYCDEQQLPVNKNGLCVDSECQAKCREKRGAKAKSTCFGSKDRKPMNCICAIPC